MKSIPGNINDMIDRKLNKYTDKIIALFWKKLSFKFVSSTNNKIYISVTEPTTPNEGDIWIDIS